jgi:hypothetical protein
MKGLVVALGLALAQILVLATPADAECDLDTLVGYTLVAAKYIAGRIDNDGQKDDFEGCDFDRIIVFDDNTGVRCITYSYSYSFHPKAYVFSNNSSMKMCVQDQLYDVGPVR